MKKQFFRFASFTLALIGFVIGFSAKVIAQYGAPPASFRIKGTITSKECNLPIPNIQLSVVGNGNSNEQKFKSSVNGEYYIRLYNYDSDYDEPKELTIIASDVDGAASGGSFASKTFKIKAKQFEPIDLNIQLSQLDTPPCKVVKKPIEIKDTAKIAPIIIKQSAPIDSTKAPVKPIVKFPISVDTTKNKTPIVPNNPISGGTDPEFNVYPNPNHGSFVVEFTANATTQALISITNDLGSVVYSKKITPIIGSQKLSINVDSLVAGTYFFSFIQNAVIVTRKIIVM
ncbi:MAG: radical SAM-associated putative lipoprotein [Bacteroidota bacterium]